MFTMKKIALVFGLAVATTSASAGRFDFGSFGGWEVYRLNLADGTDLCGTRSFFPNNDGQAPFKAVISVQNDGRFFLFIEHYPWTLPGNYSNTARIQVLDDDGDVAYNKEVLLDNNSPSPVKMFRFTMDIEFLSAVSKSSRITIYNSEGNKIMYVKYPPQGLSVAVNTLVTQCIPTLNMAGQPQPQTRTVQRSKYNPF